jgi:hypothetical protein
LLKILGQAVSAVDLSVLLTEPLSHHALAVPSGAAGGNAVNLSAPLSSWERRGFYDASAACFSALNAYRIETRSRLQGSPEAGSAVALLEQTRAEHTRCVYANDPRLK